MIHINGKKWKCFIFTISIFWGANQGHAEIVTENNSMVNISIKSIGVDGSSTTLCADTIIHQDVNSEILPMKSKWEFSTNVTLALSRFTGNVTRNLNDDPYLIMVRKIDADQEAAWRFGLNGFRNNTQSNFPDRVSSENWASLVLGREWRNELQQGAYIYGGMDARGIFRQTHSEATQFNDLGNAITSITDAKEYGGSLGAVCGFGWRFQDRISIYTESLLNAQYTRTDRTFTVNGAVTTLENKNNFKIVPLVPIALFLTIKF
jgi:hypothetical protein